MITAVATASEGDFLSSLTSRFGISFTYAEKVIGVINTLKAIGISEQDILTGNRDVLMKKYVTYAGITKIEDKKDVKRSIAYYRLYSGVSLDDTENTLDSVDSGRGDVLSNRYVEERESFLSWFKVRYASLGRGQSYFNDVCRMRESGISEEEILHDDEREICDKYLTFTGRSMSKSMVKEYRQSIRMYRGYRGDTV